MIKMQELSGQAIKTTAETVSTPAPTPLQDKEVRFFTAPKTVVKKTQLSITVFQLLTAGAVCLLLKVCDLFSPQLFENLRLCLERLFLW